MVSSWITGLDKNTGVSTPTPVVPTSTPAPQVPVQQQPQQPAQSQTPIASPNQNPHGQLFSGNLLQKAMDIPMATNYAMAGFQKAGMAEKQRQIQSGEVDSKSYLENIFNRAKQGLGGIIPAIQNRTQFGTEAGDVNAAQNLGIKDPTAQSAYNFGLSLAVPALPIGKILGTGGKILSKGTEVASKLEPVAKTATKINGLGTKILTAARESPQVANTLEKLPGLEYFRNPEAGNIIKKSAETTGSRVSQLFNQVGDAAQGLSPAERIKVGNLLEGGVQTGANIKLSQRANFIRQISDDIGKELVDLGVMTPETFNKYKGQYLSHIADVVKNTEMAKSSGGAVKFFLNSLKERKGKLGVPGMPDYIREFQFPTFKALAGEIQTAESTKALKQLASKFGDTGRTLTKDFGTTMKKTNEGLVNLGDIVPQKISHLFKDVAVPQEVADYVSRKYATTDPNILAQLGDKALSFWKAGKTIYSGPAYHVRNLLSNQILTDFATGAGLPATLAGYGRAVQAYLGKGSAQDMAYLQELKDAGVIGRQNLSRGIEALRPGVFGSGSTVGKIVTSPKVFQNASEETAKLNVFTWFREHGDDIQTAAKKAEQAIFSPYKLSQTERGLTKGIIPFYSFTRQALPLTAKTYLNNPGAITKYEKAKTAIESLSPNQGTDNLPENMQGQIRLPVKDKEGNNAYFDPTYIYPYGNFQEAGPSKGQLPFGLGLNPLISETMAQSAGPETKIKVGPISGTAPQGFDPYFQQPIGKSNVPAKAGEQKLAHAARTLLPSEYSTFNQLKTAFSGQPDYAGRSRSKVMSILNAFGIKTSIFRPQDQIMFDRMDVNAKLKSIDAERRSALKNQSIPVPDKLEYIKALNEERVKVLQGQ